MRKRMITSFLIVLIIGISITGLFSIKILRDFYMGSLEEKLTANARMIAQLYKESDKSNEGNYDDLARELSSMSNARVTIIASDGRVIGESNLNSDTMENHGERIEFKEALQGGIGKSLRYSTTEKMEMMYIAVPVSAGEAPQAVIRMAVPMTEIQKIQIHFLRYAILAIIVGFLISFIIAYKFADKITRPINQITSIAQEIANGSYFKRINLSPEDEVGQLAQTFNNMAEKLEITIWDFSDKKNKLEAILKSMQSGVIAVDGAGRVMLVNPAAVSMFGFKEDIVGKHILEAIRNVELEDIIRDHKDENKEIKLNYPEKRVLRVKATVITSTENDDKSLGVVVVMQDVTELKQLEQMRTEFVANVSHELKTPLTSIKGFTETLKDGAINDPAAREKFLDIINVEADRLTRLINDILTISELENKKQNMPLEKIDINKALEEIEDMMHGLSMLKNIHLTVEKGGDLPNVMGNHDKVKQLLINLIDNAIKYTQESGTVDVKTYFKEDKVYIEISDTGIGISEENLVRLFERFYRVDKGRSRALGGTGLGLAIVKHIVAAMNGEIKVYSEFGKGSTFIVAIPKA